MQKSSNINSISTISWILWNSRGPPHDDVIICKLDEYIYTPHKLSVMPNICLMYSRSLSLTPFKLLKYWCQHFFHKNPAPKGLTCLINGSFLLFIPVLCMTTENMNSFIGHSVVLQYMWFIEYNRSEAPNLVCTQTWHNDIINMQINIWRHKSHQILWETLSADKAVHIFCRHT